MLLLDISQTIVILPSSICRQDVGNSYALFHLLLHYEESLELILTLINIRLVVIPQENLFHLLHNTNIIKNTFKNVNI